MPKTPSENAFGCLRIQYVSNMDVTSRNQSPSFFGIDFGDRNHRQLRWTLTYWRAKKNNSNHCRAKWHRKHNNHQNPSLVRKLVYLGWVYLGWLNTKYSPNGVLMVIHHGGNWKKPETKTAKKHKNSTHNSTPRVFFAFPRCGAALEAAVTPRAVTSLEAESPRHVGMSCW